MPKILSIVDTAYRATLEEQDDTALWFTAACKTAGGNLTVLLTGNAVNYAVKYQNPRSLSFGKVEITHPEKPQDGLKRLIDKGVNVFMIRDDLEQRGIHPDSCIPGIENISRSHLSKFVSQYDLIWHW